MQDLLAKLVQQGLISSAPSDKSADTTAPKAEKEHPEEPVDTTQQEPSPDEVINIFLAKCISTNIYWCSY